MIYRYFCVSDTHGKLPSTPLVEHGKIDGTFHAGDIYNGAELTLGDRDEVFAFASTWEDPETADVRKWIERVGPVYVVHGNHDLADPSRFFERSNNITDRVIRLSDKLLVAGLGWHGDRHYELPGETEMLPVCDGLRRQLRRVATSTDCIVLVTHYPPRTPELFPVKVPETGWWHDCTRQLVEEFRPIAVVQGHIHDLRGRSALMQSDTWQCLIVSPNKSGIILTIDTDRRIAEFIDAI